MINSNPSLYQVRVYADGNDVQEMMPILYGTDRMKRLEWAEDEELFGWKYDYADTIFGDGEAASKNRLAAFVTPIEDYQNGRIGVLEAAVTMETMFPRLYQTQETQMFCFLDDEGNCYSEEIKQEILEDIPKEWRKPQHLTETVSRVQKVNGKTAIVGAEPVEELSGALICIQDVSEGLAALERTRMQFILLMCGVLLLLAAAVNYIVRRVLRQFYSILESIHEVQKGDLNVVVENCGSDEMGELGSQINKMLARIRQLMEDNINREILAKNSEIRALQNQINAHFIYNVLESIKMMAEIDGKYEISDAITSLGRLLRYCMKWTSGLVTVAEEIDYIRNYLRLMNLRVDYEIYLSLNLPADLYEQQIPKMSLQPVVENAVYHGISEMAADTNIYIKGWLEDEDCVIEISDAGTGMDERELAELYGKLQGKVEVSGGSGNGIGLKNVQDRLHMNFGERYGLEISSRKGCYTKVTMRVPRKQKEE